MSITENRLIKLGFTRQGKYYKHIGCMLIVCWFDGVKWWAGVKGSNQVKFDQIDDLKELFYILTNKKRVL